MRRGAFASLFASFCASRDHTTVYQMAIETPSHPDCHWGPNVESLRRDLEARKEGYLEASAT
jgi:hypothetical protein